MNIRRAALLGLALAMLFIASLLNSTGFILSLVHLSLDRYTDFKLEVHKPEISLFSQQVEAESLQLFLKSGGPALISIQKFSAQINALDLYYQDLSATQLVAENVQVFISETSSEDEQDPIEWLEYLGWLPHKLNVSGLHVIFEALETWVFVTNNISGSRPDDSGYQLIAKTDHGGEPHDIQLNLLLLKELNHQIEVNLIGEIRSVADNNSLNFDGILRGDRSVFSYDFEVDAYVKNIRQVLEPVDTALDIEGTLTIRGNMRGDTSGYSIQDSSIVLDNMPEYGIEASGSLFNQFSGDNGMQLIAAGEMNSLERLIDWIDIDVTSLGSAQASAKITGSLKHPKITEITMLTRSNSGLNITLSGSITLDPEETGDINFEDMLWVDLYGPSAELLQEWTGPLPYDPGPWRASLKVSPTSQGVRIHDLVVNAGTPDTVQLEVKGAINNVADLENSGLEAVSGLKLVMNVHTLNTASLRELINFDLPGSTQVDGHWKLSGSGEHLQLHDGTLTLLEGDIRLTFADVFADLRAEDGYAPTALSSRISGSIKDTSALSHYFDTTFPSLGTVVMEAQLRQTTRNFDLEGVHLKLQDNRGMALTSTGKILRLTDQPSISLHNRVKQLSVRNLLAELYEDIPLPDALGAVDIGGHFDLEFTDNLWHINNISLGTSDGSEVEIALQGSIADLMGVPKAKLSADIGIENQELLAELTTLRMADTSLDLTISNSMKQIAVSISGQVGNSLLSGDAKFALEEKSVSEFTLTLDSPHMYLEDFDLQAREETQGEQYRPVEHLEKSLPGGALEDMVKNIPGIPTDIKINLGKLSGKNLELGAINIHLNGAERRYTLRRFSVDYGDTTAEIRGIIDLNPDPPVLSLGGELPAVNMAGVISDLGIESDVQGTLTIRTGITANGYNSKELVNSMSGSLAMALLNAEVKGAAYDVLATDFLGWLYSGAALEESTRIACTRAKFSMQQGQAKSDSLYMETDRMVAKGDGELNFNENSLDLSITPRSKTRIGQIPNSIIISGPMDDPDVSISAISTYANIYSELLLIVPNFFMRLFGIESTRADGVCLEAIYN